MNSYSLQWRDALFAMHLREQWVARRAGIFCGNNLDRIIDSVSNLLEEARVRHFGRWPILGEYIWPNPQPIPANYEGEIATLKSWLNQRLQWIDNNLPEVQYVINWPSGDDGSMLLRLVPNPYEPGGSIILESKRIQQAQVRVTDMMGRVVRYMTITLGRGSNELGK